MSRDLAQCILGQGRAQVLVLATHLSKLQMRRWARPVPGPKLALLLMCSFYAVSSRQQVAN